MFKKCNLKLHMKILNKMQAILHLVMFIVIMIVLNYMTILRYILVITIKLASNKNMTLNEKYD